MNCHINRIVWIRKLNSVLTLKITETTVNFELIFGRMEDISSEFWLFVMVEFEIMNDQNLKKNYLDRTMYG